MTRTFKNFDEYCNFYNEHEYQMNDVDIVENELTISADGEFECKSWKVAIRRFFKALNGIDIPGFDEESLIDHIECGRWKQIVTFYNRKKCVPRGYHWSVNPTTIEGRWYAELTVVK